MNNLSRRLLHISLQDASQTRCFFLDRYWTPGPRRRPLPDMKYTVYGFAYLQDMVEHGIIKAQTGLQEDYGIVVQQFPYPCYIYDTWVTSYSHNKGPEFN